MPGTRDKLPRAERGLETWGLSSAREHKEQCCSLTCCGQHVCVAPVTRHAGTVPATAWLHWTSLDQGNTKLLLGFAGWLG